MNILQINSSARREDSLSTKLANELVEHFDGARVTVRDVAHQPHPALDEAALQALFTAADERTPEQAARVALDDALIAEIQAVDTVVLAVPMYNFGVPGALKNWIDAIARARVTFQYTANGPEGLLKDKKVYVVLTRGGVYRDSPKDSQVPYLRTVLGFLGMHDVEFIYAEGLATGAEGEAKALADARSQIAALFDKEFA